ncbi:Clavesin-2, partial [Stegodyphus mimosarum]
MENPVNQVAGFVAILDLKNLKLEQVLAISSWLILGTQAMQRCCPCIVKEIHLINMPPIFKVGWKLVKPLLSEKIRKRIMFHKSTEWNSLHNLISPKILPSELGGMLGPFSNQHWIQDIDSIERQYYERLQRCSPKNQKISLMK